jgi:NADH-ubiquinone oxidoreductase chain 3
MTNTLFFFIFIPLLAFILLAINLIFAPHNPYQEKKSAFECGFHSFLGQNRTQFSISFFIFALLFLLFDLEILLVYPYIVSGYANGIYGLIVMLIFFLVLTLGFAFELGKNALKIDSRQMYSVWYKGTNILEFNSQKNTFLFYTLKGNVIIKAFYHYYACFNLHFYCKLMLKSTIFKVIFLVISIFCLYILKMDSFSFNTLLLVSLFIFYTYRIYCKAKFNLNL